MKDELYMKRFQEAMNFFYKKHFKVSVFFSVFMKIGILLFSLIKMFQGKQKIVASPEHYIFISDNENVKNQLEIQLKKKVKLQNLSESIKENSNTEIILDANYIDFKTIINFLESNKNKNFTFKIIPLASDFIIGSNHSNHRGEVVVLTF